MKKRVAVIGLGSIGRRHTRLLCERDDVEVSIVDPIENNIRLVHDEIAKLPVFSTFEEALASKPDIVAIATPHGLHADQTVAALEAGCHVFCEKPASDSLQGAKRMMEAARKSDRLLNIAYMFRFAPIVRYVKEAIDRGELGNVLHFYSEIGTYLTLMRSVTQHQRHTEGSVAMDNIHDLDMFYYYFGKLPRRVRAVGFQGGDLELTSPPNILDIQVEFDGEMLACFHMDYVQYPQRHLHRFVGDRAWMELDFMSNILKKGDLKTEQTSQEFPCPVDDYYRGEWQYFLEAVDGKHPPQSPVENAVVSSILCEAALRSLRENRVVEIQELLDENGIRL